MIDLNKKVLLLNWDCYPNITTGGVYTWTKILIDHLEEFDYTVFNQLSNPNVSGEFILPKNVKHVDEFPVFGTHRYEEFLDEKKSFLKKILSSKESRIKKEFLPIYQTFLINILADRCDTALVSDAIIKLHRVLLTFDARKCLEHPKTWEIFLNIIKADPIYKLMHIGEVLRAYQEIQRILQILAIKTPKVDLVHTSAAWIIAFLGICAKRESGCPFILTEHGVAFRDFSLYFHRDFYNNNAKTLWKTLAQNICRTVYNNVDVVTPVCESNAVWEKEIGGSASKIKVIYNGVNVKKFVPKKMKPNERPTVVSVARIEPLKDTICLIQSIKYVKEKIPNVRCLVYGSSTDINYALRVVNLAKKLQLEDTVEFMGNTNKPQEAFNSADVVALTSIAEGFPFTVIEAMACGKAVVATDVGGVSEALEGVGILSRSRRPIEIAEGIVKLLNDDLLRKKFEKEAVQRVLDKFTIPQCIAEYRNLYNEMIDANEQKKQDKLQAQEVIVQ